MEFRILGPLEVVDEARSVVVPRGRGRALLALLILRAGEVLSTERLIDELWGQTPPPTALTALHGLVSTLRKRLESTPDNGGAPAVLQTRPPGYVLAIDPEQVDANRFTGMVEEAAGAPAPQKVARLRAALGLWRGPALADFTYEPFAQTAITALSELRVTAVEERIDADLRLGRHAELVAELEGLVAEHPLQERLRGQLMLALYRCGRQAEALEVYRDARRRLVEELGIEPGPVLHDLEQAILRQDASLEPPPAPPAAPTMPADPPMATRSWIGTGRKTVTVVFVDLAASATAADRPDPEALRQVVGRCFDAAVEVLTRHGGTVEGFLGDVVVAVFGVPVAHEDDALRAVRAAVELRGGPGRLERQVRARTGNQAGRAGRGQHRGGGGR